jgi:hypothetical protein
MSRSPRNVERFACGSSIRANSAPRHRSHSLPLPWPFHESSCLAQTCEFPGPAKADFDAWNIVFKLAPLSRPKYGRCEAKTARLGCRFERRLLQQRSPHQASRAMSPSSVSTLFNNIPFVCHSPCSPVPILTSFILTKPSTRREKVRECRLDPFY